MADLKSFAEQLVNLSVKEVNELAGILKEEYGAERSGHPPAAAAPVVGVPAAGESGGAEEKSSYSIVLKSPGGAKLQIVRLVKDLTGLGLKEAKAVVDSAPAPIKENVTKDEAEALKTQLEEAGAEVELK